MKVRTLISLSIVLLLLILSLQSVGLYRVHDDYVKETEATLNDCFEQSFIEAVQVQVNALPLHKGTYTHLNFMPYSMLNSYMSKSKNGYSFYAAQQTSSVLQRIYHAKELSIHTLDTLLSQKLERRGIEGKILIRKFNAETGETCALTQPHVPVGMGVFTSQKAYLYKEKNIAVEAVFDTPLFWGIRKMLLMMLSTCFIAGVILFAFVRQLRFVTAQQSTIEGQRKDFLHLAEQMKTPVWSILSDMPKSVWSSIEEKTVQMLQETERTLNAAKSEEQKNRKKQISRNLVPVAGLACGLVLIMIWAGYLYGEKQEAVKRQLDYVFNMVFYTEVQIRDSVYNSIIGEPVYSSEDSMEVEIHVPSPYFVRQKEALDSFQHKTGILLAEIPVHVCVDDPYEKYRVGEYLYYAYRAQNYMNNYGKVPIPFSLHRMDSIYNIFLTGSGFTGGIRMLRYPSRQLMIYTGKPFPGVLDVGTKEIFLSQDSTVYIEGIISPFNKIVHGIRFLLLPLELLFALMCFCVFWQIRMLRAQRRLRQFQKDFTYAMVHDMKSPLQSVMMGAHILNSGKLEDKPGKVDKYKQVMKDECEHLLALSNRVVMLTQIDRGELELHKEEIALKPLLQDQAGKFQLKTAKNIDFSIDCEQNCTVYADAFCLHEVLSNLIDNAIKYSGEEVTVILSAERTASDTVVKVRDNGIGIPLREQQKIFNRFERVSSGSRKTGASGFGLGLNYVMQVMKAHGGLVSVESTEGSYSEFTLHFPL